MNSKNDFKKELLGKEELAMVKGGKMKAFSIQLAAAGMGTTDCCNVTIEWKKASDIMK